MSQGTPKVLISTPAAGSLVDKGYVSSLLKTQRLLDKEGIGNEAAIIGGAWTAEVRNACCAVARSSGFSHVLFIDADIEWNERDVLRLLRCAVPIVGAVYPAKLLNVPDAFEYARHHAKPDVAGFAHVLLRGAASIKEIGAAVKVDDETRVPVDWLPTGFLLIETAALKQIQPLVKRYRMVHSDAGHLELYNFFDYPIVDGDRRGEDRAFGDLVREAGLTTWRLLDVDLRHVGRLVF